LRCSAKKAPLARSRISASLTGVPVKSKSSMSLASGSLAMVSWYLIERACFSANLGAEQIADDPRRLVPALDAGVHHLVVAGLASLSYLPATAAPIGLTEERLPVGLQIIGPEGEDPTTIEFARLLAAEIGGFVPPPTYR
jgi:hypothetical protein